MTEKTQQYLHISDENQDKLIKTIKKIVESKNDLRLTTLLQKIHPNSLANIWNRFSELERRYILNSLTSDYSADLISELDSDEREEIFRSKNSQWIADRLEELESDDVVDILKEMPQKEADFIIRRFDQKYSEKIKELLKYPEETAGSLISSDFLAINEKATIENIIKQFQKYVETEDVEDIHFIYVVDKSNKLKGFIPIRKLILEKPRQKVKDIMSPPIVTITASMDQEEVAKIFRDYDLISAPVVDENGVLIGRITIDDIVDVVDEEASEDVYMMVGLSKEEKVTDGIFTSLKKRLPWMFVNLFTTALSAFVVFNFTDVLKEYIILATFMPIIAAFGGATGNQMVAMVVRGLAMGELHFKAVRWILIREVTAVAIGSIIIGLFIGGAAYFLQQSFILGYIVMIALFLNMILATTLGAGIPLFLKLLKKDPALGSSILVAASTDMMGFFIFLGLATWLL